MRALSGILTTALLLMPLSAQVIFTPPNGTVQTGGSVSLKNNDPSAGLIHILLDGVEIATDEVAGGGGGKTYPVPNDPALKGHVITINVCTQQGCYSVTLTIN